MTKTKTRFALELHTFHAELNGPGQSRSLCAKLIKQLDMVWDSAEHQLDWPVQVPSRSCS